HQGRAACPGHEQGDDRLRRHAGRARRTPRRRNSVPRRMKERPHSGLPFADPDTVPRPSDDDRFMRDALEEGRRAGEHGDVPIGAAVVRHGAVVASAGNRREADADPTAHAEVIAIRDAARALGRWRLSDCALYVTVEPCAMCAGAAVLARIGLGIIFLIQNYLGREIHNWWALFIVLPVFFTLEGSRASLQAGRPGEAIGQFWLRSVSRRGWAV